MMIIFWLYYISWPCSIGFNPSPGGFAHRRPPERATRLLDPAEKLTPGPGDGLGQEIKMGFSTTKYDVYIYIYMYIYIYILNIDI